MPRWLAVGLVCWLVFGPSGMASGADATPPLAGLSLPNARGRDLIRLGDFLVFATETGVFGIETSGSASPPRSWTLLVGGVAVSRLVPLEGRVWMASDSGLLVWEPGRDVVRVPRLGRPVLALAADSEGALWASTPRGLFHRARAEVAEDPERGWTRSEAFAGRDVVGLASARRQLGTAARSGTLFAATEGSLWRQVAATRFERVRGGLAEGWWELADAAEAAGADWLVVPEGLVRVAPSPGAPATDLAQSPRFEPEIRRVPLGGPPVRAALPVGPGTSPRAAAAPGAPGQATSLVVLQGERALCVDREGRTQPLAAGPVQVLYHEPPRAFLVLPRGWQSVACGEAGSPGSRAPAAEPAGAPVASRAMERRLPEPEEATRLHRAVLRYLDLDPEALRRLERRSRWRGWLPELRVSMGMDGRRVREEDRDQSFSSGQIRDLTDMLRERQKDAGADVQLVWRLGEVADPGDGLAISKERRERIELREQVLSRVDQIFFERARLLARLSGEGSVVDAGERLELEIRVRELAAALDAWTGGAFSRAAR